MQWQLTVLIHSVLSGTRAVQYKRLGRYKEDISGYALVASYFCVSLLGVIVAFGSGNHIDHGAAWEARYFLLLGGVLFTVANYLVLKLFRIIPASIAIMMGLFNAISVLVIASVVAGESLSTRQWSGAAVLLSAVFIVQYYSKRRESAKAQRNISLGLLIASISALLIGVAVVNEKYLLDRIFLETYLLYGWGMQFFASLAVFGLLRKKPQVLPGVKLHVDVWIYALLLAFAGIFFVLTLNNSGSSSLTAVSASVKIVIAMVFAYLFLKERDHTSAKATGLIMSVAGLYLLFG